MLNHRYSAMRYEVEHTKLSRSLSIVGKSNRHNPHRRFPMRIFKKSLVAILLFILTLAHASAQSPWQIIARPTTKDLLRLSFIDSLRGWVCGKDGVILKTTNGGVDWSHQVTGVHDDILGLFMLNERIGWAIGWVNFTDTNSYYGSRILKTTDGGTTWSQRLFQENDKYFHSITFFDSLNGWICGVRGDVEKSTDGGATWRRMPIDSSKAAGLDMLHVKFFSPRYGFATGGLMDITGVVWRTTNGGERWTALSVSPEPVYKLHFSDSLHALALTGDLEYGAGIVRTKDGGNSWNYTYLGLFGLPRAMSFRTDREGWVALGNMVMVTKDTADTWEVVDTLGWRQMFDLAFTDSITGYAVADSGTIYKYDQRSVDVRENELVVPLAFRLDQNYPNPFNPTTTILFSIGTRGYTTLRVFDLLGREISTLVSRELEEGSYETHFAVAGLASGVYFYRMQSGRFSETRKLVVVR